MRSPRVRVGGCLVLLIGLLALVPSTASAAASLSAAEPYVLRAGETAPVYSFANAIRQSVWVRAPDRDGDGAKDLVTADVVRPVELDHVTPVPVIMDASPYYLCCGRGNESETKTYDGSGNPRKFPLFYDNFFEPRGYAIVQVDMAGTARSSGCADEGSASDIDSVKAVIDWLNGRVKAVNASGKKVTAYWANGTVGMIGKSYDGTLANGVAATGVAGLATIVPISAISSWYDYDRSQGLPFSFHYPSYLSRVVEGSRTRSVNCAAVNGALDANDDDASGAYTPFWSGRDYRAAPKPSASRVKASVFLVHGLQDTNVKTVNFGRWYRLLVRHHVVTKVWLSRLGHTDPFDYRRAEWVDTLHRWFDNQLMGIDNGILDEPRIDVEKSPGTWVTSNSWPVSDHDQILTFHAGGSLTPGAPETGTGAFTNGPSQTEAAAVAKGSNTHRLLYVTGSLTGDVRISGEPTVDLTITPHGANGQVGVALVDYGTQVRVKDDGAGNTTLGTQSCWGDSVSYDDACYLDSVEDTVSTPLAVLARGWARLTGNQSNTLTVDLADIDVVVPAGDQLGLVLFGASPQWTVTLDTGATPYTIDLAGSSLTLPVVGSVSFARNAGELSRVPVTVPAGVVPDLGSPANRLPS